MPGLPASLAVDIITMAVGLDKEADADTRAHIEALHTYPAKRRAAAELEFNRAKRLCA